MTRDATERLVAVMKNLEQIMEERAGTYGSMTRNAVCETKLRQAVDATLYGRNGPVLERYAVDNICKKISRWASNPEGDHRDTWMDIAGYAIRVLVETEGVGN